MKNILAKLLIFITCALIVLSSCGIGEEQYVPEGEFYIKTSPSCGDGGVREVVSLEAEYCTYEGEGDITVPFTVGLGHLPSAYYDKEAKDTFYVLYKIIESPWEADKEPAWEKRVEYADSFDSPKYNSTEQVNRPFLIFPHYGEFYPIYKEQVDITFPEGVEKGHLQVELYTVREDGAEWQFADIEFYFEHTDGVLLLHNT